MAVAGIVATSLLGISWAPSPARWGHHHSGITSRGPGGGPSVSHHAAARALEGPDGAPVPGPPGSGHHWHRGRPRCWRAAAAVAPGRGLGGGGTTVQPSAVHRRCSRVRCRLDQDLCETTLRHLPRTCTQHKSFRLKFPKRESMVGTSEDCLRLSYTCHKSTVQKSKILNWRPRFLQRCLSE